MSWRDVLPIHPAAELFPPMSTDELRELGEDIKKRKALINPIVIYKAPHKRAALLDGRNRLDAMESVGIEFKLRELNKEYWSLDISGGVKLSPPRVIEPPVDPYAYVLSANVLRRHLLDAEGKREAIAALIKAHPETSDRQIGKQIGAGKNTVARTRAKLEKSGDVVQRTTRTDTKGRQQPAKRTKATAATKRAEKRRVEQEAEQAKFEASFVQPEHASAAAVDPATSAAAMKQRFAAAEARAGEDKVDEPEKQKAEDKAAPWSAEREQEANHLLEEILRIGPLMYRFCARFGDDEDYAGPFVGRIPNRQVPDFKKAVDSLAEFLEGVDGPLEYRLKPTDDNYKAADEQLRGSGRFDRRRRREELARAHRLEQLSKAS